MYPESVFSGFWQTGHCQGIAVDAQAGYLYFSFTTMLIKTDMQGRLIGSVGGLLGHLGCLALCEEDGRIYGSLEYKTDAIGSGILQKTGRTQQLEDGFYVAVFDPKRIVQPDMDACADGVMTAVFLREVLEDYQGTGKNGKKHRYGCSGIDGITFARIPGDDSGSKKLFVAYGVYGEEDRDDNDHQVLLCYDTANWKQYEKPLIQSAMHRSGPEKPEGKFFVYTGNTTYGVQNLEHDDFTGHMLMAVYPGHKPQFANHALFAVDGGRAPVYGPLAGLEPEEGWQLSLLTQGWPFPWGSTGLCSLGDGRFYLSHEGKNEQGDFTCIRLYRWDGVTPLTPVTGDEQE